MKKTGKNKAFYPRLALENIRKNGKFYYPYLITSSPVLNDKKLII